LPPKAFPGCLHLGIPVDSAPLETQNIQAQPLMEAAGHVVVAGLLLRQARLALGKLASGKGSLSEDFYRQKLLTCRYYFDTQLAAAAASLANPRFFQTVDPAALAFP